jgi:oligopeptide transport system substrate-binding protein
VRQALAMAIDRKSIVENVTRGGQLPAYYFTPPDTVGYVHTVIRRPRGRAQAAHAQAGYPGGKGFAPFDILYNTSESHKSIAEAIQQMWKRELGIDARLLNQEWKVYLDTEKRKDYDVSRGGWIGDYADPSTFLETFLSESGKQPGPDGRMPNTTACSEASWLGDQQTRHEHVREGRAIFLDGCRSILIIYTRVFATGSARLECHISITTPIRMCGSRRPAETLAMRPAVVAALNAGSRTHAGSIAPGSGDDRSCSGGDDHSS